MKHTDKTFSSCVHAMHPTKWGTVVTLIPIIPAGWTAIFNR